MQDLIFQWITVLPSLWLGLCVHEAAHAWAAWRLGDPTAKDQGRISLYPPRHLDLLGSLILPLGLLAVSQGVFVYGWARPAPVDPARLRGSKRGFSLVALAGPVANLALAALIALSARLVPGPPPEALAGVLRGGIFANVMLALFNLAPLPGLDGIKALFFALPDRLCYRLNRPEPWVFLLLLLLQYAGALNWLVYPLMALIEALFALGGLTLKVGHV